MQFAAEELDYHQIYHPDLSWAKFSSQNFKQIITWLVLEFSIF